MAMLVKDLSNEVLPEEAELITRRGDDYRRILYAQTRIEQEIGRAMYKQTYGIEVEIPEQWKKSAVTFELVRFV